MSRPARPERIRRTYRCRYCGSEPGQRCTRPDGQPLSYSHRDRKAQATGAAQRRTAC